MVANRVSTVAQAFLLVEPPPLDNGAFCLVLGASSRPLRGPADPLFLKWELGHLMADRPPWELGLWWCKGHERQFCRRAGIDKSLLWQCSLFLPASKCCCWRCYS